MDDAAFVCCRERIGHLNGNRERAAQIQRTTIHKIAHVLAFNELHGDEMYAAYFVEIEDGANIRMVERRSKSRFAFETFEVGFFNGKFRR